MTGKRWGRGRRTGRRGKRPKLVSEKTKHHLILCCHFYRLQQERNIYPHIYYLSTTSDFCPMWVYAWTSGTFLSNFTPSMYSGFLKAFYEVNFCSQMISWQYMYAEPTTWLICHKTNVILKGLVWAHGSLHTESSVYDFPHSCSSRFHCTFLVRASQVKTSSLYF